MRYLLFFLLLLGLSARESFEDALFGEVINVQKGDVLNIREKPDYKSKKISSLPYNLETKVGVRECKRVRKSLWCKIYPLENLFSNKRSFKSGWVNAKFLKLSSNGYVVVNKRRVCFYSLGCKRGVCKVVVDVDYDNRDRIISIKTENFKRELLFGEGSIGAIEEEAEDYCHIGKKIEGGFLDSQKKTPTDVALNFLRAVDRMDINSIANFLHPKEEIIVTDYPRFHIAIRDFSRGNFIYALKKNAKVIKEFSGDDESETFIGLKSYLKSLHKSPSKISKIDSTKRDFRGFPNKNGYLSGVIIRWRGKSHYEDLGMVVILKKYKNRWFIVGLAKDRWTI